MSVSDNLDKLVGQTCVACRGGMPPLSDDQIEKYLGEIDGWICEEVKGSNSIMKEYDFGEYKSKAYSKVVFFYIKIAEIAEQQGHHPNMFHHSYNKLKVNLYTHVINGLHKNDFIVASMIDELYVKLKEKDFKE